MIRLTEKGGGSALYLNPSAIESVSRTTELACHGTRIRMRTSAIHTVSEKPEAVIALIDGILRPFPEDEPRWRVPYPAR